MIRLLTAPAILVLVGVPLAASRATPVCALALLATALCVTAVAVGSLVLAEAGAGVALVAYAIALSLSPGTPELLPAGAFGIALLALVSGADLAGRFRGLVVAPEVVRRLIRYWVAVVMGSAAVMTLLAAGSAVVSQALPGPLAPLLAGAGALLSIVAALTRMLKGER